MVISPIQEIEAAIKTCKYLAMQVWPDAQVHGDVVTASFKSVTGDPIPSLLLTAKVDTAATQYFVSCQLWAPLAAMLEGHLQWCNARLERGMGKDDEDFYDSRIMDIVKGINLAVANKQRGDMRAE